MADTTGPAVEYVGAADVARISAADWRAAGVNDQDQVVFDSKNNYRVPASALSPAALDVLRRDTRFKVPAKL